MTPEQHRLEPEAHVAGVVLSAGRGTRMRALSEGLPKPLLPLCGQALIEWSLAALRALSIRRVGVNTYHLSEQLKEALSAHELTWSDEVELQGTGGGARDLWRRLDSPRDPLEALMILNGDAWFDFSLSPLLQAHLDDPTRDATLCLRETSYDDPFGRVGLNEAGEVVRIAEVKGPRAHEEVSVGAFLGAQVVSRALINATPEGPCDLFRSAYKARLAEGARVYAVLAPTPHLWADVGTPERYLALHLQLLERYALGELPPWVSDQLPHIELRRSHAGGLIAVMEGAHCAEGASVTRGAWLYPGATVHADAVLHSAILLAGSDSRLVAPPPISSAQPYHQGLRGVWRREGFVDASGDLNAGAVGAQR